MTSEVAAQPLGLVAEIDMGQSPPGETYNEDGVGLPLVNGPAQFGRARPVAEKWTTAPTKVSRAGDVVFCVRGSTTGRMVRADGEYVMGRGVAAIRGKYHGDTSYIYYALHHGLPELLQHATGSTFPNLSSRSLSRFEIPWPDAQSRQAIAEVLGVLDDRIAILTSTARKMDQLRQTLFNEWVLDSPERSGWAHVPLGEICTTQYGFTASATDHPIGPHFVRVTDINKHPWIEWASTPFAEVPAAQLQKYQLHPGDILVARMADPGKSALIDSSVEAVFASYLVRLTTEPADLAQFVYGYLQSPEYAEYAEGAQYGSVQKNMNARVIVGCNVPMPPQEIIDRYSAIAVDLRTRIAGALDEAQTCGDLRDALLPGLVSGKLRIKDPSQVLELVV